MSGGLEVISEQRCFGGVQRFYAHAAETTACMMRFAVFSPPAAERGPVPVLYYLAGLTCTEETFTIKAGAQRHAAEHGLMLVAPDTSPRGCGLAGEDADWDFGTGAGFYLDATQAPWSAHYRMYSYVTAELPALVAANFPARSGAQGIFGHSMGGHGALVCALRNPGLYKSVSALAPISAPMRCPWGRKAFSNYLGADEENWRDYDASALVASDRRCPPILIDQGADDPFLARELYPGVLEEACAAAGQPLRLRMQAGYDHSYYFIASFIEDHIRHHAGALNA
ncbi:MAG: S-formylglutathione hydrolase [Alphaproteobacteria bacterium]